MKRTIRLRESELRRMISESVKRVLREGVDLNGEYYRISKMTRQLEEIWKNTSYNEEGEWGYDAVQKAYSNAFEALVDLVTVLSNHDLSSQNYTGPEAPYGG